MKSSETKRAKQPGTRNPKATASKRSAKPKARQAPPARALAAKKLGARKSATKQLAAKKPASKKSASKKPAPKRLTAKQLAAKQLAPKKSGQKVKTKTTVKTKAKTKAVAAVTSRATPQAAKTRKILPVATRASASGKTTASAAKKAAAAARSGKPALTPAATAKRAVSGKPVEAVRRAAASKPAAAPKNSPALEASPRKAAKPATVTPKAAEPKTTHAAQNPAVRKGAAAALLAAFKRNVARLSEVRKQAASAPPPVRPAVNPANLSLESNERVAVIKETEKKTPLHTASGQAGTNSARQPAKDAAAGETARAGGKGAGKPQEVKAAAMVSKAPPPVENRPVALAPIVVDAAAQLNSADEKSAERPAAPVSKPAKTGSSQRQMFKPGEYVVYPAHGVGQIIAIEEQEVAGFKLELFVISFIKDKMILKVPTPKVISVGMRKLADAAAVKSALDTLAGRARVKRTMWSRRAQEYEAKINSGDLNAIAEVVRDLYRSDTQPEQSYSERQLYEAALDRMTREIVVVQKLTETESLKVIEAQLQKGPRRGKAEEIDAEEAEIEEAA
jgi:CarD family transcriptional regulator